MINWHKALRLYFVAGTQDIAADETLASVLQSAIISGITCYQFREKGTGSLTEHSERVQLAKALQALCKSADIPFIVNDDVALAIEVKADAVHVGQSDRAIAETIAMVKPHGIDVGLSVNTLEQLAAATEVDGLDYVGVGPIFPTTSKLDAEPAIGTQGLSARIKAYPALPKVAIGGITVDNAPSVLSTKVEGIAVISAITQSSDRKADIHRLLLNH